MQCHWLIADQQTTNQTAFTYQLDVFKLIILLSAVLFNTTKSLNHVALSVELMMQSDTNSHRVM